MTVVLAEHGSGFAMSHIKYLTTAFTHEVMVSGLHVWVVTLASTIELEFSDLTEIAELLQRRIHRRP